MCPVVPRSMRRSLPSLLPLSAPCRHFLVGICNSSRLGFQPNLDASIPSCQVELPTRLPFRLMLLDPVCLSIILAVTLRVFGFTYSMTWAIAILAFQAFGYPLLGSFPSCGPSHLAHDPGYPIRWPSLAMSSVKLASCHLVSVGVESR